MNLKSNYFKFLKKSTPEEAIQKLGIVKSKKAFKDIDFGTFTGNHTLIKWWKRLLKIYNLEGNSYMFWKAKGND